MFKDKSPRFKIIMSISSVVLVTVILVLINAYTPLQISGLLVIQIIALFLMIIGAWGLLGIKAQYKSGQTIGGQTLNLIITKEENSKRFMASIVYNLIWCILVVILGIFLFVWPIYVLN